MAVHRCICTATDMRWGLQTSSIASSTSIDLFGYWQTDYAFSCPEIDIKELPNLLTALQTGGGFAQSDSNCSGILEARLSSDMDLDTGTDKL